MQKTDSEIQSAELENPFGTSIRPENIIDDLEFFDNWEDRYRYIIYLGKQLPGLPVGKKTDDRIVRGCQSQVWIDYHFHDNLLRLNVDSDAFIVKGLLAVVLAAFNHTTPSHILEFDIENYFDKLNLIQHLSITRGNGLRSMVARIKSIALEVDRNSREETGLAHTGS